MCMFFVRCRHGRERTGKVQTAGPWLLWLLVMRYQQQLSLVVRHWQHRQLSLVAIRQHRQLSLVVRRWQHLQLSLVAIRQLVVTWHRHQLSLVVSQQCHRHHYQCVTRHCCRCHQVTSWRRRAVPPWSVMTLSATLMTRKLRRRLQLPSLTGTIMLVVSNSSYSSQPLQLENRTPCVLSVSQCCVSYFASAVSCSPLQSLMTFEKSCYWLLTAYWLLL